MGTWKSRGGKSQGRERCGATWRDEIWKIARRCGAKQLLSQNVKNTSCSEHFWKWTCSNSACGCGTKHISKRKCEKHRNFAALLHVKMSKKCTPLWREANFEVKMWKAHHVRTTLGRSTAPHYTTTTTSTTTTTTTSTTTTPTPSTTTATTTATATTTTMTTTTTTTPTY